jgi:hypothetical protein
VMTHNVLPLPRSNGFHGSPSQRCEQAPASTAGRPGHANKLEGPVRTDRGPADTLGRSLERRDALAERVDGDGRVLAAGRQLQRRPGGGAER